MRWEDLTIRELMVELGRIEEAAARAGAGHDAETERRHARRERAIISELHRRHDESAADPGSESRPRT